MVPGELIRLVDQALNQFYANDSVLFKTDASEWSLAHRLAVHLETGFVGWNVDCEYNRMGTEGNIKQNSQGGYRRPDIIVHHREMVEVEHNLLVIELKRKNCDDDSEKLKDFTSAPTGKRRFQYSYGLSLSFDPELSKRWFYRGREVV